MPSPARCASAPLPPPAGTILLGHIAHIEWDDIGQAIPAFLTIILMPFTYSGGPPPLAPLLFFD